MVFELIIAVLFAKSFDVNIGSSNVKSYALG
jgi:hypothetical protein